MCAICLQRAAWRWTPSSGCPSAACWSGWRPSRSPTTSIWSNHSNLSVKKLNNPWPLARQVIRSQVNITLPYTKPVADHFICDLEKTWPAPESIDNRARSYDPHLFVQLLLQIELLMVKYFLTFYTQIFFRYSQFFFN